LLVPASYAVGGDPSVAGDGVVLASDNDTFLSQSIAGAAVTTSAPNGAAASVQMRWPPVDSTETGGADTWNLFYLSDSTATAANPMWTNAGTDYVFAADGSLNPPIESTTIANLTVNGTNLGDIEVQHGSGGVSQFAAANGLASVTALSQNGYAAGEFVSVAVSDNGRIVASYSNGRQVELAQVVTADFNSANNLKRLDGGSFAVTSESGEPIYNYEGGVLGGSLEASNTDISEEFTKLIVTQQAYAAGTRIVSTSNDMLQEALNMVR
jgi:flagellar hook protein FlgE